MNNESSCENLDVMATLDNQSTSVVPKENLVAMTTEDNQSISVVPKDNLVAMAIVDNQPKLDALEVKENKLVGNHIDLQEVTEVTLCEDLTKDGIELQDKGDNGQNFKISQEGKEVENIHIGQDLINKMAIINSDLKSQNLGKNDADIVTNIQLETTGSVEDCVAMVTVKTEPIIDEIDNITTWYKNDRTNVDLDLPQSSHIQNGLIIEDGGNMESQGESSLDNLKGCSLMAYRVDSDGESDGEPTCNSTSSSSSSESSDGEENNELNTETKMNRLMDMDGDLDEKKIKKNKFGLEDIRTRGELSLDDLPPIEDLHITADEKVKLVPVGQVSSVIGCLVVIQSNQQIAPLNEDTILFLEDRTAIGQVFEIFGPVILPWYSFRFNSTADLENKGIKVGTTIFYAPEEENFTKYVFVNALRQLKGSDASWENNNEPPEWVREFSDDEEEKRAKQKKQNKNRNVKEGSDDTTQMPETKKKRNRQREKKTQGNITVKVEVDSTEFAPCQEWPPRDGGPNQGYRYSNPHSEFQGNPFHNVPEQHHYVRNQHFAQRNRSNQWRPQMNDNRRQGFRFGGCPSFSSRFNQPYLSNSNYCPPVFPMRGQQNDFSSLRQPHSGGQMRGQQNDFSSLRQPHSGGQMHRLGNSFNRFPNSNNRGNWF